MTSHSPATAFQALLHMARESRGLTEYDIHGSGNNAVLLGKGKCYHDDILVPRKWRRSHKKAKSVVAIYARGETLVIYVAVNTATPTAHHQLGIRYEFTFKNRKLKSACKPVSGYRLNRRGKLVRRGESARRYQEKLGTWISRYNGRDMRLTAINNMLTSDDLPDLLEVIPK